jgi:hypothetical protein
MSNRNACIASAVLAALVATPSLAIAAEGGDRSVEERLKALEDRQTELERQLLQRDARIRELEAQVDATGATAAAGAGGVALAGSSGPGPAAPAQLPASTVAPDAAAAEQWGRYEGGKGMVLARNELGEVDFSVFSYARYLNQKALQDSYTDSFGRTRSLDLRQDLQLQKVNLSFKGWLFDPDFRYLFYTWTSNTSQGQGAQVVVAGNLSYRFNDAISLAAGIGALPSTRSTNYTFPNWLRVDNRTVADEFFRGSYTSGIWASGQLAAGLRYRVMIGNNLSQLGVMPGSWMPTSTPCRVRCGGCRRPASTDPVRASATSSITTNSPRCSA